MATVWDWFFPKECVGCMAEGSWLCASCLAAVPLDQGPVEVPAGLDGLVVATGFAQRSVREAIHTLKYAGVAELAVPLGRLLCDAVRRSGFVVDAVVALPLHPQRQRERGYNQAELLARQFGYPLLTDVLVRYRYRPPQALAASPEERAKNIAGVFGVRKNKTDLLQGKSVLLVDDVCTTGATLREAARVLRAAGAYQVYGAVVAK